MRISFGLLELRDFGLDMRFCWVFEGFWLEIFRISFPFWALLGSPYVSGFQPSWAGGLSWAFGPGWYVVAPSALGWFP